MSERCHICDRPQGVLGGPPARPEQCVGGADCRTLRVDWRARYIVEKGQRESAERRLALHGRKS